MLLNENKKLLRKLYVTGVLDPAAPETSELTDKHSSWPGMTKLIGSSTLAFPFLGK